MTQTAKYKHFEVVGLANYYEILVKQNRYTFVRRTFSKKPNSTLYKKCEEIHDYCTKYHIDPMAFIRAQFDGWRDNRGRHVGSFPTLRWLGATDAAIKRYLWNVERSRTDVEVFTPTDLGAYMLKTFCRVRSEEEVFRDPIAVRALPVDFVVQHPKFLAAKAKGCYNHPMTQVILKDYLWRT
jgi:hypothetical protein